ncbi:MAG: hypothetical protein JO170_16495 [Verrucomicrobia bacterium]|nr:hypothetical protein [Verrucomicrobiota bacterium]
MNDVVFFARFAGIVAFLTCILTSHAVADDSLVFDFGPPRKFSGFGVQLWPATSHLAERDALLRDLHCRFVRVGFTSRLTDEQLKNHMSVAEISSAINKAADADETTVYSQLHDEINQLRLKLDLVFWQVPSTWCISSGDSEFSHARINPDNIQDYANWIAAHLLYAKRLRLLPSTIELINEPDSAAGTQFSPEQYDALVFATRATLDRTGLAGVGIEGPGVASASTVEAYTQVLERTGHISLLAQLSWHDMDTVRRPEPAGFCGIPLGLLAKAHQLPIAITEFSSENPQWERSPYDSGPRNRGDNNAADSPDFAVSVVAEAIKLVGDGANSLSYWQAEDPAWTQDAFGLLNEEGQRKPAAAALQMFSELIPPNCDVAKQKQLTFGLASVCVRTERDWVLATANLSQDSRKIDARIVNSPFPTKVVSGRRFDSHGATPQLVPAFTFTLDSSELSFDLPARSVMVFVLR